MFWAQFGISAKQTNEVDIVIITFRLSYLLYPFKYRRNSPWIGFYAGPETLWENTRNIVGETTTCYMG